MKTTSCPNSNKIFNNFLFNSGLIDANLDNDSKAYQRRRVYYTICVFLRLALAGLVLQLKDKIWIPYLIGIFSLILSILVFITSNFLFIIISLLFFCNGLG